MSKSKFYDEIRFAKEEREVEDVYNKGLSLYFLQQNKNLQITHPFKCDGCIEKDLFLKLLIEYKYDEELQNEVSRAKVLVQVLYYLKRFEENGDKLPNVVMVGDINEVFVIHSNDLIDYLDEKVDWSVAPSNAHEKNSELVMKIAKDENINPFVFVVDDKFSFKDVADKINDLAFKIHRYVRITEHNISKIFDYFTSKVIKDSNKIAPNDLVGIFINSIIDKENCYKHPNNPNLLVASGKHVQINGKIYDSFFSHFEKEYSPQEKNKFTEISDRLIEDTKRRRSGEFYTPTLFTDYAHKMLSEELGEDWKEKYVVWDCCWGTGNLTRDYQFKELYASTLEQAELDCGARYNPEATKFVFDFLNDDISNLFGCKLPQKLYEALEQNRPIVFFINPPYATANNKGSIGTSKDGCALTRLNKKMLKDGMGKCSQQIYAQFLYRILLIKQHFNLSNIIIGLFCKPNYMTAETYKLFRKEFLNNFCYKKGILFNAGYFSNVSAEWGINFTIWKPEQSKDVKNFNHDLVEIQEDKIHIFGKKNIYNIDDEISGSAWVKEEIKNYKTTDAPQLTTGINIKAGNGCRGKIIPNSIGYYVNIGNNCSEYSQGTTLYSSCCSRGNGCSIQQVNFHKVVEMFSARKLIPNNWINDKDEFCVPNIEHEKYSEFKNDSIVYSLFNTSSNQSSLRNIEYKNQTWNIKNEFFFMSKNEIMELANKNNFDFTYNDARVSEERFVYKKLQEIELSKEAKDILDKAIELTNKSFKYRELFNQEHPEYQIMNWDCGWYQIKAVLKEYFKEDLDEFSKLYKILADKMRPMVYELGFLK